MEKKEDNLAALFEDPDFSDFTLCMIIKEDNGKGKRKRTDEDAHDEDVETIKSRLKEQQSEAMIVFESKLERDTFKRFIQFIYTKEIANDANPQIFLRLAHRFDCHKAISSIAEKISTKLTIEECCEWLDTLILHKDKPEIQTAIKKIELALVTHFHAFRYRTLAEAFELLPQLTSKEAVLLLLGSNLLHPPSEEIIFTLAWYWHNIHQDTLPLSELATVFRWKSMTQEFLHCIRLLPVMDEVLLRGIDGTSTFSNRREMKRVRTPYSNRFHTVIHFSVTSDQPFPPMWIFYGGFRIALQVHLKDHQLTFSIKKSFPSVGCCLFPLRCLSVMEDGKTKADYEFDPIQLTQEVESVLDVTSS